MFQTASSPNLTQVKFEDLTWVDMRDLIAQDFQYGMTMDGILHHYMRDCTAVFLINSDYMSLIYCCETDDFCDFVKQKISIDWLYRKYGNMRAYFLCPECGNRVMVLYNTGVSFMCRRCCKNYSSIYVTDTQRTADIESRLKKGIITVANAVLQWK